MNKTFLKLGCLVLLLSPGMSQAATSSTTAEFLRKLNGYYYCLSQQGLKNYHCDVDCAAVTPSGSNDALWKAAKEFRFHVDDSAADVTSVQGSTVPATGDAALDARVGKFQQTVLDTLKAFLQSWKSFVMEPLNDTTDMEKNDLKFKRTDDGFQVTQSDPSGGTFTGFFDKKGKMVEFLMQEGGSPTTVQPGFTNTQKGYLLTGLAVKASDTNQEFKIEYGVVDRYWLPKELGVKVNLAEAGDVELHFHFSNYRVNQ